MILENITPAWICLHKWHSCHLWQIPCLIGYHITKWLHTLILTSHISSILQRRYARDIWNCNFNIEEFFILVWLKSNWIMSLPSTSVFQIICEEFDTTLYSVYYNWCKIVKSFHFKEKKFSFLGRKSFGDEIKRKKEYVRPIGDCS